MFHFWQNVKTDFYCACIYFTLVFVSDTQSGNKVPSFVFLIRTVPLVNAVQCYINLAVSVSDTSCVVVVVFFRRHETIDMKKINTRKARTYHINIIFYFLRYDGTHYYYFCVFSARFLPYIDHNGDSVWRKTSNKLLIRPFNCVYKLKVNWQLSTYYIRR